MFVTTTGELGSMNSPTGGGGGSGTVTSVSVVTANGFAGTVSNPTTNAAITLTTTVTGILKGNGTSISAGVAGTDYSAGTAALATGILKSTTVTGALSIAVAGTDYPATGVIAAGGPTGSSTVIPVITWNANGQLTVVTTASTVGSVTAADTSITIGGTATAPTVATGTLDVIATQHPPAADWSNNSHKITNLANGTAAQDAAAFGQIPTILPDFTVVAISATGNSSNLTLELVTTAGSTITRTLPAPTANATIAFKKVDSGTGTVVISHHAAETIDGLTTQTIVNQWSSLTLVSDGTNWFVI